MNLEKMVLPSDEYIIHVYSTALKLRKEWPSVPTVIIRSKQDEFNRMLLCTELGMLRGAPEIVALDAGLPGTGSTVVIKHTGPLEVRWDPQYGLFEIETHGRLNSEVDAEYREKISCSTPHLLPRPDGSPPPRVPATSGV